MTGGQDHSGDAVRQRLAEISARADAATAGPWRAEQDGGLGQRLDIVYVLGPDRALLATTQTMEVASEGRPHYDAAFIASARQEVPRLVAALTAVLDMHKPVRRYQESPDSDCSYDSAELVAELWEVDVSSVTHFEVCAHCGPLEMATDDGGCYEASLWPCDTYRAVAAALEEQP